MEPFLAGPRQGNAGSAHAAGRTARAAIEAARADVALLAGCDAAEIVFTSGGTESLNLAVKGLARARRDGSRGALRRIVTTSIEQLAVLHPLVTLEREGFEIVRLAVGVSGLLDPERTIGALDDRTALLVTHHANHEVGVVQPVAAIAAGARARGIPVACDATASAGLLSIEAGSLNADLVAISAHRFGGPKGAGALRIAAGTRLRPEIEGGAQEGGLRAGTENVAAIVGMGVAAWLARAELLDASRRLEALGARLRDGIVSRVRDVRVTSPARGGLPGLVSAVVRGLDGDALLALLDEEGIAASSGSACATGAGKPSHVLLALGIPPDEARGSLLLSLGRENRDGEVDRFLAILPHLVERLRRLWWDRGAESDGAR